MNIFLCLHILEAPIFPKFGFEQLSQLFAFRNLRLRFSVKRSIILSDKCRLGGNAVAIP